MFVSQAEFARLACVSRSAVKQAINNGLITAITEQAGKVLINKTEGLAQYKANSRKQRSKAKAKPAQTTPAESKLGALSWGQAPSAQSAREPSDALPPSAADDGEVPDFNEERARHEREKRLLAELARQEKERELLRREDVETAWGQAVNLTRVKLLGVPSTVKQRIPHLEVEEIEVITALIREALEELASGEVAA